MQQIFSLDKFVILMNVWLISLAKHKEKWDDDWLIFECKMNWFMQTRKAMKQTINLFCKWWIVI